jgi:hypothetical protein
MDWMIGFWTKRGRSAELRGDGLAGNARSFGREPPAGRAGSSPPVLLTSIPKAGTHLLTPVLCEILGRRAFMVRKSAYGDLGFARSMTGRGLYYGHLRSDFAPWSSPQAMVIVLLRDPRDLLVSLRDFLLRGGAEPGHQKLAEAFVSMTVDDQYRRIIDGVRASELGETSSDRRWIIAPLTKHCSGFTEWAQLGASVIRYEEMFDGSGPSVLAKTLGWAEVAEDAAERAVNRWVGCSTSTFNVGRPGRWRSQLSPKVLDHLAAQSPDLVSGLGYGEV